MVFGYNHNQIRCVRHKFHFNGIKLVKKRRTFLREILMFKRFSKFKCNCFHREKVGYIADLLNLIIYLKKR